MFRIKSLRYKKIKWIFIIFAAPGEMAEWSNAAVSKTVVLLTRDRGFESPSLR
jgi:hypothetical protein